MEKLSIKFENCYGIRSLETELDFSNKKANLIYAPNGVMKTSFAKTFKDHSDGLSVEHSRDRIYEERQPVRVINDETGAEVPADEVFVIEPYVSSYLSSRISSLLVDSELKTEYDKILDGIETQKTELVTLLSKSSGVKKGIEDIVSIVFTREKNNFLKALDRVKNEVKEEVINYSGIRYSDIFNDKVESFLNTKDFKDKLLEYTNNYDSLLSGSTFFKKGVFNHYQAGEIASQLKKHGFFQADHSVYVTSQKDKKEITSEEELKKVIELEMQEILADSKLKTTFNEIDTQLKTNQSLRSFREFLLENQNIIPELANPELFKEKLLKSYLIEHKNIFLPLMSEYEGGKKRISEITDKATNQATKWQEVINIFNRRFSVPFKVSIENKQDVILKRVTPNIVFHFSDDSGAPVFVDRDKLVSVLSNGEKRALYILNIIFEVEARKEDNIPTIFVVDDIADSFDYKNKYAIVEYLQDILEEGDFKQIILTHNYDFYRTIWKRFSLSGANYHVSKTDESIQLIKENMYRDPFVKWKKFADNSDKMDMFIALIPFVRNLAGYCGFTDEEQTLTCLLHIKSDTDQITIGNLVEIFGQVLNGQEFDEIENYDRPVKPLIYSEAQKIIESAGLDAGLEKKLVLSMAIRLKAEEFLIGKIADEEFVQAIPKNQTAVLISEYKRLFSGNVDEAEFIKLMERVNLMTPENIHLNSFMYEPILDLSMEHLVHLYREVLEAEGH